MKKITLLIALVMLTISGSYAQSAASYAFSSSMGTFTENSGAATTIAGVRADTFLSTAQNIGFTFVYEGNNYTQFKMSSNGFISFNTAGTSSLTGNDFSTANATSRPIIAPLWDDLDGATPTTSLASYELTGVAPNRVLTVEWKNWEWNWNSGATPVISFQVKLYETTNVIEFVYRQEATNVASGSATIGIGSATGSGAGSYLNLTSVTTPAVSSTTSTTTINTKPATGQIFTFSPPVPCTGMPTAGTITPAVQNICTGITPANLVAAGYSTGVTGITFQWEESNDNGGTDAWAPVVGGTGATTATYTPAAFAGATIYYRLNVTCTASGMSAQTASVMVTTPVAPTNQITAVAIPAGTIAYTQAVVNWTNGNGSRRAVFISDSATFTDPVSGNAPALTPNTVYAGSGQQLIFDGTAATVTVTGLSAGTQYYIKAYEYVRCGAGPYDYYFNVSTGTNIGSFTTCASLPVPASENFTTYVPDCWQEADNGDLTAGPATFGSSSWIADGFGNVGSTGAMRVNLDATGDNDWILSPMFAIPATGYELKFDASANQWASTSAPTTAWEADDFVEVLVSTGTTNWTVLYTYNNANVPSNTGSTNILDLDAYAGQTVRFAFRGFEGATNGAADIEFIVDNFEIRLTPSCSNPLGLVVNNLDFDSADITWTPTTGSYEYVLDNVATDPVGSGTSLSGEIYNASLSPSTTYYFHVRTVCPGPIYSVWSTVAFTTLAVPPVNDDCTNATALTPGGVYSDNPIDGTNNGATTSSQTAPTTCFGFSGRDVWYSVVVPPSGNITIETGTPVGGGAGIDTVITAYTGDCTTQTQVGCDDDGATETTVGFSRLALTAQTPGATILIRAYEYNNDVVGSFGISAYDASLSTGTFDSSSFKAYPNPVSDVLHLSYSSDISSVEVYNMLGQQVITKTLNVTQGQIDMSNLTSGNYIVKVTSEGVTKTIKVVKK